jgi:uncharacterized membrane protein
MMAFAGAVLVAGTAFFAIGAWPVALYLGIAALLTYCAFRLNYRAARHYEQLDLTSNSLTLTRVPPSGPSTAFRFNPYWVRFDLNHARNGHPQLSLTSHGRTLTFGAFLSDDEKLDFADAFAHELGRARDHRP